MADWEGTKTMTLILDSLTVKVPEGLDRAKRERLAVALFDAELLTQGQAAEMVGVSLSEFLSFLGRYGVSVFQYSAEEAISEARRK